MTSGREVKTSCEFAEVQEIIKEFLSKYRYLHEFRIQKLLYFSELYAVDNYERRLSDATWKPYMYGSYSDDVRTALGHLEKRNEVAIETVRHNGGKTTKYLGHGISGGEVSFGKKQIIDRVHKIFKSKSNDELGDESKSSWLYKNEEFDEPMNFENYLEYIQSLSKENRPYYDPEAPDLDDKEEELLLILSPESSSQSEASTAN